MSNDTPATAIVSITPRSDEDATTMKQQQRNDDDEAAAQPQCCIPTLVGKAKAKVNALKAAHPILKFILSRRIRHFIRFLYMLALLIVNTVLTFVYIEKNKYGSITFGILWCVVLICIPIHVFTGWRTLDEEAAIYESGKKYFLWLDTSKKEDEEKMSEEEEEMGGEAGDQQKSAAGEQQEETPAAAVPATAALCPTEDPKHPLNRFLRRRSTQTLLAVWACSVLSAVAGTAVFFLIWGVAKEESIRMDDFAYSRYIGFVFLLFTGKWCGFTLMTVRKFADEEDAYRAKLLSSEQGRLVQ